MTDKNQERTSEWLLAKRKSLGFTQKEMAEKLNTPLRTYQDWEYGARRIPGILTIAIKWVEAQKKS